MSSVPSSNWIALKRTLSTQRENDSRPTKRQRIQSPSNTHPRNSSISNQRHNSSSASSSNKPKVVPSTTIPPISSKTGKTETSSLLKKRPNRDPDSKESLQAMIRVPIDGKARAEPSKFVALDCEMVGVGPFGLESALARVTIVNYVGDIVLDEFVRPQEQVTDWRTHVSGIRKEDMAYAKTFQEVQSQVSSLLEDRFLVGHAVHNDLTALLLSHPWRKTRDTQTFKPLKSLVKSQRPALRKLVKAVFDIDIQQGEHNSVIDARATMALYRVYRKEWEGSRGAQDPPNPPATALIEALASSPAPPSLSATTSAPGESPFLSKAASPKVVAPHRRKQTNRKSDRTESDVSNSLPRLTDGKVLSTLLNAGFQGDFTTMPAKDEALEKSSESNDIGEPSLSKDSRSKLTSDSTATSKKTQPAASKTKQNKKKKVQGVSSGISVVVKRNADHAKKSSRTANDTERASGSLDRRALDRSHKQSSGKTNKSQTQGEWWKELN